MQKKYRELIFTNHAINRMRERGIKQSDAWATWKRPDNSRYAENKGAWVYYRHFPTSSRLRGASGGQKIEVVAKKNEKKEWIILSVWSRPVFKRRKKTKKKSFWQKLFGKIFLKN